MEPKNKEEHRTTKLSEHCFLTLLNIRTGSVRVSMVTKSQVDEIRSTGQSLMPEGLEQGLNPQDFADLIAYIRQLGSK